MVGVIARDLATPVETDRAPRRRLCAALRLHPADPRPDRRCGRQGAGHEGVPRASCFSPCSARTLAPDVDDPVRPAHGRRRRGRRDHSARARAGRRPGRDGAAPGGDQPVPRRHHHRASSPDPRWPGVLAASSAGAAYSCVSTAMLAVAPRARPWSGFRHGAERPTLRSRAKPCARYGEILANPRAPTLFFLRVRRGHRGFRHRSLTWRRCSKRAGEGGPRRQASSLAGFAIGGLVYSALVSWLLQASRPAADARRWGHGRGRRLLIVGVARRLEARRCRHARCWGWAFTCLHNSFQTQVTELAPEARASAVALHAFSFFVGQALGVVIVGLGLRAGRPPHHDGSVRARDPRRRRRRLRFP